MKKMKNTVRYFAAVFVMVAAFLVTGITSQAAVNGLKQVSDGTDYVNVEWEASGYEYCGWQIATDADFKNIIKSDWTYGTGPRALIYGLSEGTVYYVRVGGGNTVKGCYANWSSPLQVITKPGSISDVKFVTADDNSATIQYSADGADTYFIYEYTSATSDDKLICKTANTSYKIPIDSPHKNTYYVIAAKTSNTGYVAKTSHKSVKVNLLTTKIAAKDFKKYNIMNKTNKMKVWASYYGDGYEVELMNAGGSKYSNKISSKQNSFYRNGSETSWFSYKENKFLKYRVRAYVDTDNGRIYGQWSDDKAFCEMNVKYTRGKKKVNMKWAKVNGSGKIKVMVSTKKSSKYKTFKTLKGSSRKVTVNKYGKSSLKKGKAYYFRVVPLVKINGKYVASEYYFEQKVRIK